MTQSEPSRFNRRDDFDRQADQPEKAASVPDGERRKTAQAPAAGNPVHSVTAVASRQASRYWAFQWYELAIYLGLAVILAGICLWWVQRRLA